MNRILTFPVLAIFAAAPCQAASLEEYTCNCQAAVTCGADECGAAFDEFCTNSSISFSTDPPHLNFCIGEDCMAGEATLIRPEASQIWMHGNFGHTAAPEQNPTSVTLLFDTKQEIGVIQSSDEQGVNQTSVICRPSR